MQCAHKNLATSDLLLKSELLRLFYLLASTPGLCTEHTVSTESRMTETLRKALTLQKNGQYAAQMSQMDMFIDMNLIQMVLRFWIFKKKVFLRGLQN